MFRALLLSTALSLAALPAVARENYAILIGVNKYPTLAEKFWLNGPGNDVELVKSYLTGASPVPFSESDITVLADAIPGAGQPTLAGIRGAFADLTAKLEPGDFVYLHFSGHGSQAPALRPEEELDGLDELFLPADIGPWEDSVGTVQNALVDDEIGEMIDALRAKGADVFAVFDSCHSGTVTRGAPVEDDVRMRKLEASDLGIPAEAMQVSTRALPNPAAQPDAPIDQSGKPGEGSFVAFFAAQTNEVTPEKNLPMYDPARKLQGVFTYSLFQVLAEYPGASYGQIGQEVLRKYATQKLATSTPMFEGDLDRVAFSGTPGARVSQWTASVEDGVFAIPAGALHGLKSGDRLAVMAKAAEQDSAALGYVTLTEVDTFSATATADADTALPEKLPKGLLLRKLGQDLDYTLTVALPEAGSAPSLEAAQDALQTASGARLVFVPAGQEADLRLAVIPDSPHPDAIWVLPATGVVDDFATTPSVSSGDKTAAELGGVLADTLGRMARAINLQKLGNAVGEGSLDVQVDLLTGPSKSDLTEVKVPSVPRLVTDDQVHILATNKSDQPVDVNVLYIAADYSISHWFSGRMLPGSTLRKGLFKIGDEVFGAERMIVVLTPAKEQSPIENLDFLAQDSLDFTREVSAELPSKNLFKDALTEAGFGQTTRSATALDDDEGGPAPGIYQIELRTGPAN